MKGPVTDAVVPADAVRSHAIMMKVLFKQAGTTEILSRFDLCGLWTIWGGRVLNNE